MAARPTRTTAQAEAAERSRSGGAARAGATPTILRSPAGALGLQRAVGNRATSRLLSSTQQGAAVQRLLVLGSNTGWGVFGWVDSKAEQLWKDLDRKFNTELGTQKTALLALKLSNPFAADEIDDAIARITTTQSTYDGPIHHDNAAKLNALLDEVIGQAKDVKVATLDARTKKLEPLIARLGTPLTALPIDFASFKGLAQSRKDLLGRLTALKASTDAVDPGALATEVKGVETAYAEAKRKTAEARAAKLKEQQAAAAAENLKGAELLRVQGVLKQVEAIIPKYNSALTKCGGDADLLLSLAKLIKLGEGGQLDSCLNNATGAKLVELLTVKATPVTMLNKLLIAVGAGEEDALKGLLNAITAGEEAKLLKVIEQVPDGQLAELEPLVTLFGITALDTLTLQGDADELTKLFVTDGIDATKTKALLATSCADHVVFLLTRVPDVDFITKLRPLAASVDELVSVVDDLPRHASAVGDARVVLNRAAPPATMAEIKALGNVQKARGLKTNAGATIGEVAVGDLTGTGEKKAVQEGLTAIADGKAQTLTHASGAKFGEPFDNNAGRLPGVAGAGGYKEYYVEKDPASGTFHGERRLVKSNTTGHIYYTDNHYASFRRIQ